MSRKPHRPNRVTLLAFLCLWLAIWNGIRLGQTLFFWKTLETYGASPWYIAVSGGTWLLLGLILTFGLWRGKAWAWVAALGSAAGYGSWYWFDRLVMQEPRSNWPFALGVTALLLIFAALSLFTRPTRIYFGNDRTTRNSNPA